MRRGWVLFVVACGGDGSGGDGGDERTFESLAGAPSFVHSLGFDPAGQLMAAGGELFASPRDIFRLTDSGWEIDDIAPGAQFVPGSDHFVANTQVYRLASSTDFHWEPLGAPEVEFIQAITPDGKALTLRKPDPPDTNPSRFLHYWESGPTWTPIPGTEGALEPPGMIADANGGFTWAEQTGLYRLDGDTVTQLVDCDTPELRNCADELAPITHTRTGDLLFTHCTGAGLYRATAAGATRIAELPIENFTSCAEPIGLVDDQLYMVAGTQGIQTGDATNTAVFRLDLATGAGSFERLFSVEAGWSYRVESATIYRYASRPGLQGIGRAAL